MDPLALSVPGLSPAFVVVVGVAGLLTVCAVGSAVSGLSPDDRNARDGAIALLGATGVTVHVVLALRNPTSIVGFMSGIGGAGTAVVAASRTTDSRPNDLTAQALGVTGLVWIAGSVTVVGGTVATDWPFVLAGVVGVATLASAVIATRVDPENHASPVYRRASLALGTALLVPAVVGVTFGPEVLFVVSLVGVGSLVVCWWLVRAHHATRRGR